MSEKTNMEKWAEAEERSLDLALAANAGSDEEKAALKQAAEIHDILNEDLKQFNARQESKRKIVWDIVKCVAMGVGGFAAKLYFTSREEKFEDHKIDKITAWETDGNMPTYSASKQTFNNAFRKK